MVLIPLCLVHYAMWQGATFNVGGPEPLSRVGLASVVSEVRGYPIAVAGVDGLQDTIHGALYWVLNVGKIVSHGLAARGGSAAWWVRWLSA